MTPKQRLRQNLEAYYIAAVTFGVTTHNDFQRFWRTVYDTYPSKTYSRSQSFVLSELADAGRALGLAVLKQVFLSPEGERDYDDYLTADAFVAAYIASTLLNGHLPIEREVETMAHDAVRFS